MAKYPMKDVKKMPKKMMSNNKKGGSKKGGGKSSVGGMTHKDGKLKGDCSMDTWGD